MRAALGRLSSAGTGYTPGRGPEPALTSARRTRPAVCSIPPRPSCSPAGSWPEEQHWQRDLTRKAKTGVTRRGTHPGEVKGARGDPFPKTEAAGKRARRALPRDTSAAPPSRGRSGAGALRVRLALCGSGSSLRPVRPSLLPGLQSVSASARPGTCPPRHQLLVREGAGV